MFQPTPRHLALMDDAGMMATTLLSELDRVPGLERRQRASEFQIERCLVLAALMRQLLSRDAASRRFITSSDALETHGDVFVLALQASLLCAELRKKYGPPPQQDDD